MPVNFITSQKVVHYVLLALALLITACAQSTPSKSPEISTPAATTIPILTLTEIPNAVIASPQIPTPSPVIVTIPIEITGQNIITTCDNLLDDHLRAELFDQLTPDNIVAWIKRTYQNPSVGYTRYRPDDERWEFPYANSNYSFFITEKRLVIIREFTVVKAGTLQRQYEPTVQEVFHCYGMPDYYRANIYDDPSSKPARRYTLNVSLIYVKHGIDAELVMFFPSIQDAPAIKPNETILLFRHTQPDSTLEKYVENAWVSDNRKKLVEEMVPWTLGITALRPPVKP